MLHKVHNRISRIYNKVVVVPKGKKIDIHDVFKALDDIAKEVDITKKLASIGGKKVLFRDLVRELSDAERRFIGNEILFQNITKADALELDKLMKLLEKLGKVKSFYD